MDKYYTVWCVIDGDIYVNEYNKEQLEELINDKDAKVDNFIDSLSCKSDPIYWKGATLIIKGEIIVPKEKKTVVKLVLE